MRRLTALALFVWSTGAAAPAAWRDIFPPKDFKGWTRVAFPATQPLDPVSQWKLDPQDRRILCEGNRGHEWLRYDRELADFTFHVEWRFLKREGETKYNSGIFIRNTADGALWHQAQCGLTGGFLFGNTLVGGEPKRFHLRDQMSENRVTPAGEWNTYEIRCQGRTIELSVNGAVTSAFTGCELPKGYIGLEAEGFPIEFRNLKLRELR